MGYGSKSCNSNLVLIFLIVNVYVRVIINRVLIFSCPKLTPATNQGAFENMELLLVSGLLCDDSLWTGQVEALSCEANITIVDHKSHDLMEAIAEDILSTAPPEFALAGFSMGGYICLEIMRQAPERVLKLALLDTSPYADSNGQKDLRRQRIEQARKCGKASISSIFSSLIDRDRYDDKDLVDALFAMDENNTVESFEIQQRAIISRSNSVPLLSAISCPVLVLCGRQDALTPLSVHREMADKIPGATLVVLDKCGHASTMERPAEVSAAILEWLKN